MDHLIRDVRYSIRMLLKAPGLTLVAVISLALGIGANTTIFTLINAVLLNPIPVEKPQELAAVFTVDDAAFVQFGNLNPVSRRNYLDFREEADAFSDLAAYSFAFPVNLSTGGEPEQIFTELASGNYFDVLGLKAQLGRTFYPDEDVTPGTHPVVVMAYGLWQRRFGGDPGIVGREIRLNGHGLIVIGVAPEGFKGVNAIGGPELWVPMMMYNEVFPQQFVPHFDSRRALVFNVAGRLAPGRTLKEAKASLETVAARLEQEYPVDNKDRSATALPLTEAAIFPGIRQVLVQGGIVLMAVVGLVLLIACSNVANLLLAKASTRRKEIAVRLSLGAGRRHLVRQLLIESVLLAVLGGGLGLLIAFWARDIIWAFRPPFLQQASLDLSLDARVLGFTFAVSVVTGLLFGLAPALQSTRTDVVSVLKEEGRGTGPSGRRPNLRNGLVVAQVALSLVALVAAGLFVRSLGSARDIDPGFEREQLAMVTVTPEQRGYEPEQVEPFYRQLLERAGGLPGVRGVALSANLPLFGGFGRTVFVEGQPTQEQGGKGRMVNTNVVSPGYFETAGIRRSSGRTFGEDDNQESRLVVVVNQKMAEQFWPDQDPIGKRFKFFDDESFREVVGVVETSNYVALGEDPQPAAFMPLWQSPGGAMTLYLRSEGDPAQALAAARRAIRELDPEMPMTNTWTVGEVIDQSLWAAQLGAALLAVLGLLALSLASVGLYGVMAYWVGQRNREIGIRMALGAHASDVLKLVLRQSMVLVGLGVALGVAVALLLSSSLQALLYGISPSDPVTFAAVVGLLLSVAFLASWLPARRATRVDPLNALHTQ